MMESEHPVTPLTALVIDAEGRLTYVGVDGLRRVIVGDNELWSRFLELHHRTDGDLDDVET